MKVIATALALTSLAAPALAAGPGPVAYRLSPVLDHGAIVALSVELRFTADAGGETRLRLPDEWGGGDHLWRFVHDLKVAGADSVSDDGPAARTIRSRPNAALTVTYRVSNPQPAAPNADGPNFSEPIIRPDWLYVIGDTYLAYPESRLDGSASVKWSGTPRGWTYASDLEQMGGRRDKLSDVRESVILAAPDLKIVTRQEGGAPVRVAARGTFAFADPAFVDMVLKVVAAERAFWKGGQEPFLVTLAPLTGAADRTSLRGTNLEDAFAVIATTNTPLDMFRVLLTHEYFHTWNPVQTGGNIEGPQEPAAYWVSEGFTDFYARRLALRAGLIDLDAFVDAWNAALAQYAASPARAMTNAEMTRGFWEDEAKHKLPYDRGSLLAALFDWRVRQASGGTKSLDDVMFAMRDLAATLPKSDYGTLAGLLPVAMERTAGVDIRPDIARYVDSGEPVLLPADAFGGCIAVKTVQLPAFDRGFDAAKSAETGLITGVDPDGPAYAAGLRDGFKRVAREGGKDGDSRVEIGYRAIDATGVERLFKYRPQGKATMTLQELEIASGLSPEAKAGCARAVAGGQAATASPAPSQAKSG